MNLYTRCDCLERRNRTMASTPSASALSAVLRCRGNIWTRNPPTKRPSPAAYGLGLSGGSPAERARSKQASAWEAFLQGDRVLVVGRRLTVAYKSGPVEEDSRDMNKLCHPKLSQSAVAHGVQSALLRQLARSLTADLPGRDKCSQIIQTIKHGTCAVCVSCRIICAHEIGEFPVLKVSITSRCWMGKAAPVPSLVLTGWSTLKRTCSSLTALVSQFMFLKLAEFWGSSSSPDGASQPQNTRNKDQQINGHSPTELTSSEEDSGSGLMIPDDRPD